MELIRPVSSIVDTTFLAIKFILLLELCNVYHIQSTSATSIHCPNRCTCLADVSETDRLVVNCKLRNISALTTQTFIDFPKNYTKTLIIECDSSDQTEILLQEQVFHEFYNLHSLRLQKCATNLLPPKLLLGLNHLRSLHLNRLNSEGKTLHIPDGFLASVPKLEKLIVTNSQVDQLPTNILCDTPNIQVVNVSRNELRSATLMGDCIQNAEQLIILDMSSNRIQSIDGDQLRKLIALRELLLANNQITHMDRNAFSTCTLLQHLQMQNNNIQDLPTFPETLMHLDVSNNQLSIVPTSIARLPELVTLNLSGNSIDANTPFTLISDKLRLLDLSGNVLEFIPEILLHNGVHNSLEHLMLSNNRITQIEPAFFANFTQLITLDLDSNRLSDVNAESLFGLISITHLHLANNSIYEIEPDAFDSMPHIAELDLSKNLLLEIPLAVGRLFKIRRFDLSSNQISKTHKFLFNKMPNLHYINLDNNKLISVDPYTFYDIPRLLELHLSHNTIDHVDKESFVKCTKLRHLDLSHNFIQQLNGALLPLIGLRRLNLSTNSIEILQWTEFPSLLTYLDVSNNQIALVGNAQSSMIKHIQLEKNRMMTVSRDQLPRTVELLDISDNLIQTIDNGTFGDCTQLHTIDMRHNQLISIDASALDLSNHLGTHTTNIYLDGNPLLCTCQLDWILAKLKEKSVLVIADAQSTVCTHRLNKQRITLSDLEKSDLLCSYKLLCEPNCICCEYGNCDCKSRCPDGCECFHDAAYTTNIVRCFALDQINRKNFSPKDLPMYATHIYLERMNMSTIRSHDFLGRTRLLALHINQSAVNEIKPLAFNTLPSLKVLDLSGNKLKRITGDEVYRTSKLEKLLLHGNELTLMDQRVSEVMPSLQVITLNNNSLEDLPSAIEAIGERLKQITIGFNPFRCDCTPKFRTTSWLSTNVERVADVQYVNCVENVTRAFRENHTTILSAYPPNDGDDIFTIPMLQFIATANSTICAPMASGIFGKHAANNTMLLITVLLISSLIALVIGTLAIALLKRTNRLIAQRQRCYKMPQSLSCTHTTSGSSPIPLIHFDAFVSYSKKDEKTVVDTLCRQLESEEYLLCLLHRDGPNYNTRLHSVSDELINQMECAQTLILVLTQHFLDNEWRTLQIKTSHHIFAKNRQKKLIALLDDGIEPNQLEAELGQVLRKNTCIRMSDPLFWNLLHSALPIRIPPSSGSINSSQIYSDCYGSIVPSDVI